MYGRVQQKLKASIDRGVRGRVKQVAEGPYQIETLVRLTRAG
jgi:hypothetical protein